MTLLQSWLLFLSVLATGLFLLAGVILGRWRILKKMPQVEEVSATFASEPMVRCPVSYWQKLKADLDGGRQKIIQLKEALDEKICFEVELAHDERGRRQTENLRQEIIDMRTRYDEIQLENQECLERVARFAKESDAKGQSEELCRQALQKLQLEWDGQAQKPHVDEESWQLLKDKATALEEQLAVRVHEAQHLQKKLANCQDIEKKFASLVIQIAHQTEKLALLEGYGEHAARVESLETKIESLKQALAHAENENRSLRGFKLAESSQPVQLPHTSGHGLGLSLDLFLNTLFKQENLRGLVLADDNGLPVAVSGEYTDELSAAVTYADSYYRRIQDVLPLTHMRCFQVEDANHLVFSIHPFQSDHGKFLLGSLGVGTGLDGKLLSAVAQTVQSELNATLAATNEIPSIREGQ